MRVLLVFLVVAGVACAAQADEPKAKTAKSRTSAAAKDQAAKAKWAGEVRKLTGLLHNRDVKKVEKAQQELLAIRDPLAVDAIMAVAKKAEDPAVRELLLAVIIEIPGPEACLALATYATQEPIEDTRLAALEKLQERRETDPEGFEQSLPKLVPDLIEKLTTKVTRWVTIYKRIMAAAHINGQWVPGVRPALAREDHKITSIEGNDLVLQVLQVLTEEDFGYNKDEWTKWWRSNQSPLVSKK